MTRRARCTLLQGALALVFVSIALPRRSAAQVCPVDRYCFYVPPGLPLEASHSNASSRSFDIVLSSPTGDVSGSYSVAGRPPVAITVSPGHSLRIPLSVSDGPASAYQAPESRGVFLVADSPNLTVDHRETFDQEQYSETIKRSAIALGSRFRLGGYSLNLEQRPLAGVDSVLIYAPTGASVTLTAPPSATLPFWSGSASTSYTATLGAGQTLAVRTEVGRDIDGALLTSSAPVAVSTGGRGWSEGGCGDDGMDGLVPTSALGREHVVRLPTGSYASNGESRVRVIADVDGTEVRVDGALVATLAAGAFYSFEPTALSYVQTSRPALVWMNGSLDGCELDTVLIPPIAFLPALTELSLDFNVIASNQTPSAELAILIATPQVASIRLDGAAPPLISSDPVPGRADLTYVRFDVTPGDHNVRAGADFQALLASRTQPSGLLAYYNPYRIPGCGDGALDAGEGCDDGNPSDGDGCSASCVVEPGYGCSGLPSACVTLCGDGSLSQPSESCDDGNTAAGDGCNVTCRREVTIAAPPEGASLRALPNVSGTADPLATITLSIGSSIALLHADSQGAWSSTPTAVTSDGPVMITASATDLRGGLSTAARTLRIDTMTSVAIAEPRSGATLTSATPTLRGTGEPGAQLELRVDDRVIGSLTVGPEGTWTFQVTEMLRDGAHGVTARSQDAAGNRASATSDFRVDTRSGPFLLIHNLPDGAFTHDPRPLFSGAADPGAQVIVTFDDVTLDTLRATARGSWTLSLIEPLQPGTHTLRAETTDARGRTVVDQHRFRFDEHTTPVALALPFVGSVVRTSTPVVAGTAAPGARVQVLIDDVPAGDALADGSGRWSLTTQRALSEGHHGVRAIASDGAEHPGTVESGFYVDTSTFIEIRLPAEGAVVGNARPTLSGLGEPGAIALIWIDDRELGEVDLAADGSWSLTLADPLAAGEHTVRAEVTDPLRNTAQDAQSFTFDPAALDSDGDGRPDRDECNSSRCRDSDGDGAADNLDPDDDGDGLQTAIECSSEPCRDSDGDMQPDYLDPDDDADGRPTAEEHAPAGVPRDSDADGTPDQLDPDDDGDGLSSATECMRTPCPDSDGDGTPDWLDPDDDNDQLPTNRERGDSTQLHNDDFDGDGNPNWRDPDANANGIDDGSDGVVDTDGDGVPGYLDAGTKVLISPAASPDAFTLAGGGGCSTSGHARAGSGLLLALLALLRRRVRVRPREVGPG